MRKIGDIVTIKSFKECSDYDAVHPNSVPYFTFCMEDFCEKKRRIIQIIKKKELNTYWYRLYDCDDYLFCEGYFRRDLKLLKVE